MRTYRTKEEVPWGDILEILRWYLRMKTRSIRHAREREDRAAVRMELPDLRMGYESDRQLRRFLGYKQGSVSREAEDLLQQETQER